MLLGQNRGGHQNGCLFAVQHALHHRPQRHLRLAVAYVTAQKPVHRPGPFHIRLDLRDGPELVVRLGIGKGLLKLLLPGGVRGKGKAGPLLPFGVQLRQPLRQVLGSLLRPGLLLGPLRAAQLVEPGPLLVLAPADILADLV